MLILLRTLFVYWRTHRLQLAVTLFGVALGVAVVTAMDIANGSAMSSFRRSMETVNGKATHQIVSADGFTELDESLYAQVFSTPGVVGAAPVIETHGLILKERAADGSPDSQHDAAQHAAAQHDAAQREAWQRAALVRILGVDPFSERPFRVFAAPQTRGSFDLNAWLVRNDGCVISQKLATTHGLSVGGSLELLVAGKTPELARAGHV